CEPDGPATDLRPSAAAVAPEQVRSADGLRVGDEAADEIERDRRGWRNEDGEGEPAQRSDGEGDQGRKGRPDQSYKCDQCFGEDFHAIAPERRIADRTKGLMSSGERD